MNLIDVIFIALLLIFMLLSARKGFLFVLLQYVGAVSAALLAKAASAPASTFIYNTYIQDKVTYKLTELMPHGSVTGEIRELTDSVFSSLPGFIRKLADQFNITQLLNAGASNADGALTVDQIEAVYVGPIVTKALSVLCLIILFIVFYIVIKILVYFLNKSLVKKKEGVLSTANKLLGALLGAARGTVAVALLAVILTFSASFVSEGGFKTAVTDSYVCNYVSSLIL